MSIYPICNPSKFTLIYWLQLCTVMLMLNAPPLLAQDTAIAPASAEIEQIIATIEDEQKRAELLGQLRLLNTATQALEAPKAGSHGADLMLELTRWVHSMSSELVVSFGSLKTLPDAFGEIGSRLTVAGNSTEWLKVMATITAVLFCAWLFQMTVKRLLSRPRTLLEGTAPQTWLSKLLLQLGRAGLDLLGIGAFTICAYLLLSLVRLGENSQLIALAIVNITLLTRTIAVFSRLLFSPELGALRLISTNDEFAHYWDLWIRRVSIFSVYGYLLVETVFLLGLAAVLHKLLLNLLGLVVLSMLIIVIQQNRTDFAVMIAGEPSASSLIAMLRRRFASIWNVIAMVYLVFIFGVWVADLPGGFSFIWINSMLSLLFLALAMAAGYGLHRAIDRGFRLSAELRARIPSLEQRTNRYVPQLKATVSVLVTVIVTFTILDVWGIEVLRLFENDIVGEISARLGNITLIMVVAYVIWEVLSITIEHGLARAKEESGAHARLETLLPLVQKTALLVISTLVIMIVLSELGLDIGPLLAAAGVLGLAVGFGAQTLVKDIITGAFILIENSISVDDYIEVGGHEGTVESVSIRTIQLRDVEGSVHTVPFSSVSTVLNYTRDFSISKLEIGVAYREDIDHVIEVLNQIGSEMLEDPELAKDTLEPLVVQGVQSLGDSSVNIRARIKTTAGMQWAMRREFHKRVKKRFDELGIEIPFPHQTVYFGVDQQGQAPAAQIKIKPPE